MMFFCACGGSDSAKGTLTLCIDGNGLNEMFVGPILAEFGRLNPDVELVVEYIPVANSYDSAAAEERSAALTRTRTELMSGEGADIYLFFNMVSAEPETYMLFPNMERQIQAGIFHDLDFLYECEEFNKDEYIPALTQTGVYNGKSYVLPISYTAQTFIALEDKLSESGFSEEKASEGTKAFMEEMLALSKEERQGLGYISRYSLLKTGTLAPVSIENAEIQLNTNEWQDVLQLTRQVIEETGYTEEIAKEEFMNGLDYEQRIAEGAVFLPVLSVQTGYYLRLLEDNGYIARLLPIPNEEGSVTMMSDITATVSAGCENTDAAAKLLLFFLSETVQGCGMLEQSNSNANLFVRGIAFPVRKGCAEKVLENMDLTLVEKGTISEVLKADLKAMEERVEVSRLGSSYDAELSELTGPYLEGVLTWEECYANIEKEWTYLDE